MARRARLVVPGLPHHITHRGNRRKRIFMKAEDHKTYLRILHKFTEIAGVEVWAYCLMPNHVHIIALPERKDSLAEAFRAAHGTYAEVFNGIYGVVGHLWEGRFASYVMDEQHLRNAVRYVERNPVRAGLVDRAEDYPWSSAGAHCGLRPDLLLSPLSPLEREIERWSEWLAGTDAPEVLTQIRQQTSTGQPFGGKGFLGEVSRRLGRDVTIRSPGRPPGKGPDERNGLNGVNGDCPQLPHLE